MNDTVRTFRRGMLLLLPDNIEIKPWYVDDAIIGTIDVGFHPVAPHIWVPKVGIVGALGAGAAAAIIANPEVTRRLWSGWRL